MRRCGDAVAVTGEPKQIRYLTVDEWYLNWYGVADDGLLLEIKGSASVIKNPIKVIGEPRAALAKLGSYSILLVIGKGEVLTETFGDDVRAQTTGLCGVGVEESRVDFFANQRTVKCFSIFGHQLCVEDAMVVMFAESHGEMSAKFNVVVVEIVSVKMHFLGVGGCGRREREGNDLLCACPGQ